MADEVLREVQKLAVAQGRMAEGMIGLGRSMDEVRGEVKDIRESCVSKELCNQKHGELKEAIERIPHRCPSENSSRKARAPGKLYWWALGIAGTIMTALVVAWLTKR